jgi:glycosyltransferase involved in cell wall biosynthesis
MFKFGRAITPKDIIVVDDLKDFKSKTLAVAISPQRTPSLDRVRSDILQAIKPLGFKTTFVDVSDIALVNFDYKLFVSSFLRTAVSFNYYCAFAGKNIDYLVVEGYTNISADEHWFDNHVVFTPSEFSQFCMNRSGVKTQVIPHGVNPDVFFETKTEKTVDIFTICPNLSRKGYDQFIQVIKRIKSRLDIKVHIHSPYGVKKNDEVYVTTNDLDDATLRNLYSSAKLYVLPSLVEGFGMTPLEAMACGCAVVTLNAPAMNEYMPEKFMVKTVDVVWKSYEANPELTFPLHMPDMEHYEQLIFDILTVKDVYQENRALMKEVLKNYYTIKHYTALFADYVVLRA